MDASEILKQFSGDYQEAAATTEKKKFTNLPDGYYLAMIDRSAVENKFGFDGFFLTLKIMEGEYKDRLVFKNYNFGLKFQLHAMKEDLKLMGIDLEGDLTKLEAEAPMLLDKQVEIQLKTTAPNAAGKVYQNTYIKKEYVAVDEDPFA